MLHFVNFIIICVYFTNVYNLLNLLLVTLDKIKYFKKLYDYSYN